LIEKSLSCLRQCLEATRARRVGSFNTELHRSCESAPPRCGVPQVASLNASLAQYVDELSLVFFKKENLRGKKWWISVFYSLVIQSVVRKSLVRLVNHLPATPPSIKHYLHLAVRLFIASSGGYDPIAREWSTSDPQSSEEEIPEIRSYEAAKLAVRQKDWNRLGLRSSGDYLQRLFEHDGLPIENSEMNNFDSDIFNPVPTYPSNRPSLMGFSPAPLTAQDQRSPVVSHDLSQIGDPAPPMLQDLFRIVQSSSSPESPDTEGELSASPDLYASISRRKYARHPKT
jgi:hypothetical protein